MSKPVIRIIATYQSGREETHVVSGRAAATQRKVELEKVPTVVKVVVSEENANV